MAMNEFFESLGKARDKARRYGYKCLIPNCSKKAINSHLVQQHPFLESIAEDGKVYQIGDNEISPMSGDFSDLKEKTFSIQQALSMPLFCSQHDNDLFKLIESGNIDYESTKTFLLFSLRGLASQRYLEEKRQVLYQNTGNEGEPFDVQRDYSKHVINRFDSTLGILLQDIEKQTYDKYVFETIDLPYAPFCGSDAIVDEDEMAYSYSDGDMSVRPINTLYLTLLPMGEKEVLKVIIGYHKDYVGEKQKAFYEKTVKSPKRDTFLQLVFRMKNWCCSLSVIKDTDFATIYEIRRNEIIWDGGC